MSAATPGLLRFARNDGKDQTIRVRVDAEADCVTLILSDAAVEDSAEIADGIVADYDAEGRIVGIEVLDASKRTATRRRWWR